MSGEAGDRLSRWREGYWDVDNTPWHKKEPNDSLVKYWHKVTQGRQGLRVLFPLCGASVDLSWLYQQNHTVVGVEGVRKGVEKLFTEANVEYDVSKVEGSETLKFQTQDKRLTVYLLLQQLVLPFFLKSASTVLLRVLKLFSKKS